MGLLRATDASIVRAINSGSVPSEDLVSRDGWKLICTVRGRNYSRVDEEAWTQLCSRRGYLQNRSNPRGF